MKKKQFVRVTFDVEIYCSEDAYSYWVDWRSAIFEHLRSRCFYSPIWERINVNFANIKAVRIPLHDNRKPTKAEIQSVQ